MLFVQEVANLLSSPGLVGSPLHESYGRMLMPAVPPADGSAPFRLGDLVAIGSRNQLRGTIRCGQ